MEKIWNIYLVILNYLNYDKIYYDIYICSVISNIILLFNIIKYY